MNIVVEGPDNTGKSTLIEYLSRRLLRPTHHSGGPEKYPGEIDERISNYLTLDGYIFDRHPAISECMYAFLRGAPGPSQWIIDKFYETKPIIVYCRPIPGRGMDDHDINEEVDTPQHVEDVKRHYDSLWQSYDVWALSHAHLFYRIGDDRVKIHGALWGMIYAR